MTCHCRCRSVFPIRINASGTQIAQDVLSKTMFLVAICSMTTGSYIYRLSFYLINIESYGTICHEYSWDHHSKLRVSVRFCFLHSSAMAWLAWWPLGPKSPWADLYGVEWWQKTLKGKKLAKLQLFPAFGPIILIETISYYTEMTNSRVSWYNLL